MKKSLYALAAIVFALMGTSCNMMSDPETEKKIAGKWETRKYMTEDGMKICMHEEITYNLSEGSGDNTFESRIKMWMIDPITFQMGTIEYSGTWTASKEKLIGEIDKNSVDIWLSPSTVMYLDYNTSQVKAMKRELRDELDESGYIDGGKILDITDSKFSIEDEEDGEVYKYTRI